MTISTLLMLGWLGLVQAPADQAPEKPAQPDPPKFEFTLGAKNEQIGPGTEGAAKTDKGKIDTTTDANQLKTVLTGGAGASVFLGCESSAVQVIRVTQEFDISCTDSKIGQVVLTLESTLKGFIRSKHKASACVRAASVSIAPAGWQGAPLCLSHPTYCASGAGCGPATGYAYDEKPEPIKTAPMPLGRYVLQATFMVSADAGGLLDAHSTAVFVSESEDIDPLEREHDPFKGDKHDDFGFTIVLKADSPPGFPSVAKAKKKSAPRLARSAQPPYPNY